MTTCLEPVWDGPHRMRCGMGAAGICYRHGPHQLHPYDGRLCKQMRDGYCKTHGVYVPLGPAQPVTRTAPTEEQPDA